MSQDIIEDKWPQSGDKLNEKRASTRLQVNQFERSLR